MIYAYLVFFLILLSFIMWRSLLGRLLFGFKKENGIQEYEKHDNRLVLLSLVSMLIFVILGVIVGMPMDTLILVTFALVGFNFLTMFAVYIFVYKKKPLMKVSKFIIASIIHLVTTLFLTLVAMLVVSVVATVMNIEAYSIEGFSMGPEYEHSEKVLVSTEDIPQRNSVVVFSALDDQGLIREVASRTVGMPGDTISISDAGIFVNDEVIIRGPRDSKYNEMLGSGFREPYSTRVFITDKGIIPAIEELQNHPQWGEGKQYLPETLKGDPTNIAIQYGWFRAQENFQDINAAESRLVMPGSFLDYRSETTIEYVGYQERLEGYGEHGGWSLPYDYGMLRVLTLVEPAGIANRKSIILYLDADGNRMGFEKTDREDTVTFTLSEKEYFTINDQHLPVIDDSPWHIVELEDIRGVVFSKYHLTK